MDSINNACKFGSDAWLELQAFKTRQLNRREKLNRHKNLNQDINSINPGHVSSIKTTGTNQSAINNDGLTSSASTSSAPSASNNPDSNSIVDINNHPRLTKNNEQANNDDSTRVKLDNTVVRLNNNNNNNTDSTEQSFNYHNDGHRTPIDCVDSPYTDLHLNQELVECLVLLKLCDVALKLPVDSRSLQRSICRIRGLENTSKSFIENLLQKFAHQELITIDEPAGIPLSRRNQLLRSSNNGPCNHGGLNSSDHDGDDESCIYVISADHTKLVEFDKSIGSHDNIRTLLIESKSDDLVLDDYELLSSNGNFFNSNSNNHGHNSSMQQAVMVGQSINLNLNNNHDTLPRLKSFDTKSHRSKNQLEIDGCDATDLDRSNPQTSFRGQFSSSSKKKHEGDDLESLLSLSSTREKESKKLGEELLELLSKPTAKERNLLESFRSADGYQVQEFCPKGTKGECRRNNEDGRVCDKLHFKKIIAKHTEESLGDCSFLNTCFHMDSCKYVHYEVDYDDKHQMSQKQQHRNQQHQFKRPHPADSSLNFKSRNQADNTMVPNQLATNSNSSIRNSTSLSQSTSNLLATPVASKDSNNNKSNTSSSTMCLSLGVGGVSKYTLSHEEQARIDAKNRKRFKTVLYPPQWIQCDLRFFDMSLLGKFSVVMADPPWDIHMELPYGTMSDDEMRKLNIPALQDEGVIFLWVTGRAMELGRECLALWGYDRCDEIIWVKTNQLQRIIRTGRTGHWLNHGKEHCLVGVKGNPKDINRGLDCDVIVAEVRATSHKPDEIYGIIERLSPGTRKIELFGRAHNVQPNWITLGNQLNGVRLVEPNLVNAFKKLNLPFQTGNN